MKAVFQIIVSIVVGSLLGISVYNKLVIKNTAVYATDMDIDLSLLGDQIDFTQKQKEADSLAYTKYQDSLQRTILIIEKESVKSKEKAVISQSIPADVSEKKPATVSKTRVGIQPKIELAELKKSPAIANAVTDIPVPVTADTAPVTKNTSAAAPVESVADGAAQSQPHSDKKKKFLFFNKKNNSN